MHVADRFLEAPGSWRCGYDVMKVADLSSGTLYPLLARLSEDGWIESRWQESEFPGRPRLNRSELSEAPTLERMES